MVQKTSELLNDPQLKHRNFFPEVDHSEMGELPYDGFQFLLSRTPGELRPAPCLGEHNKLVCTEILGMSDEEFEQLYDEGVFK